MRTNKKTRGRKLLTAIILILGGVLICLVLGIVFSLPSRTAELYGPPNPDLPLNKLYSQSVILLLAQDQLFQPIHPQSNDYTFPVNSGDSLDSILDGLTQLGFVNHSRAFRAYLIYSGIDTRIQPGDYQFSQDLTELELAKQLGDPQLSKTTLTVLAGWRAEEIAEGFSQLGINIAQEDFLDIVRSNNKEGYLFPGSYNIERDILAESLVELLFSNFISQITSDLESRYQEQGLSLHQAVILASIIEREAVQEEEMPLIASVFLNRLREEMNLAADPTVQYAKGYNTEQASWWTNPLSLEDLKIPSPYNTYEFPGLPPGPICSPGIAALNAVAFPADSTFLYFRAACDGSGQHLFAENFEDHLENACD